MTCEYRYADIDRYRYIERVFPLSSVQALRVSIMVYHPEHMYIFTLSIYEYMYVHSYIYIYRKRYIERGEVNPWLLG